MRLCVESMRNEFFSDFVTFFFNSSLLKKEKKKKDLLVWERVGDTYNVF